MNRSIFVFVCVLATVFLPAGAQWAQQPTRIPHIAFLALLERASPVEQAFLQGLRDLGYVDGKIIIIDYRWAAGKSIVSRNSQKSWCG